MVLFDVLVDAVKLVALPLVDAVKWGHHDVERKERDMMTTIIATLGPNEGLRKITPIDTDDRVLVTLGDDGNLAFSLTRSKAREMAQSILDAV